MGVAFAIINLMVCEECKQPKTKAEMQSTLGRNGKVYLRKICKKCVNKRIHLREKISGTTAWQHRRFRRFKYRALKRDIDFQITFEQYTQTIDNERCYFCAEKPDIKSIDRLDNSLGYVSGNIVMACAPCNTLKRWLLPSHKHRMLAILSKMP